MYQQVWLVHKIQRFLDKSHGLLFSFMNNISLIRINKRVLGSARFFTEISLFFFPKIDKMRYFYQSMVFWYFLRKKVNISF